MNFLFAFFILALINLATSSLINLPNKPHIVIHRHEKLLNHTKEAAKSLSHTLKQLVNLVDTNDYDKFDKVVAKFHNGTKHIDNDLRLLGKFLRERYLE